MIVAPDEIRFHPHSFGDPAGRLFWWRDELYRGVRAEAAPFVTNLVDTVLPTLVERRLVPATTPTDLTVDGFALVLRHERVPFTSYPNEWCSAMLRDASLLYLDLVAELVPQGLCIKDMNPWNLVFDGTRPLFVDVMSIAPLESCPHSFTEERFRRNYLDPLHLMERGEAGLARTLLPEWGGVPPGLLGGRRRLRRSPSDPLTLCRRLRRQVEAIALPAAGEAAPADRETALLLDELRPASVLELRTSHGAAAALAARNGAHAIAFFEDDTQANGALRRARSDGSWLLPLVLDVAKPTPSIGFLDHFSIAATDRLRSELVVSGDAVRYAVAERRLTSEHVAEALAAFSTGHALASLPPALLDRMFPEALRTRFAVVTELTPAANGDARFLCRK